MVNLMRVVNSILELLLRFYGLRSQSVEIEPGTVIHFWAPIFNKPPSDTCPCHPTNKPVLLLLHGFGASGVLMWLFQIISFSRHYSVVVPDLIFFGGSATVGPDRSPEFQAECLARGLRMLGVESCAAAVGSSYGGIVLSWMAAAGATAGLVRRLVVSNSNVALTQSESRRGLGRVGVRSWAELLLPENVDGLKRLLRAVIHRRLWLPDWAYKHFLEVMFEHREERAQLLTNLITEDHDFNIPKFSQKIYFITGEEDQIFNTETVQKTKEELGDKASLHIIKKASHLVHIERPFLYNRLLKSILETPL